MPHFTDYRAKLINVNQSLNAAYSIVLPSSWLIFIKNNLTNQELDDTLLRRLNPESEWDDFFGWYKYLPETVHKPLFILKSEYQGKRLAETTGKLCECDRTFFATKNRNSYGQYVA